MELAKAEAERRQAQEIPPHAHAQHHRNPFDQHDQAPSHHNPFDQHGQAQSHHNPFDQHGQAQNAEAARLSEHDGVYGVEVMRQRQVAADEACARRLAAQVSADAEFARQLAEEGQ